MEEYKDWQEKCKDYCNSEFKNYCEPEAGENICKLYRIFKEYNEMKGKILRT